ncbi:LytTR family DNA-binding domain-containing protein [Solilutibacter silvestris]|uniref:LytTr DNA-binding domain-containing protein n=1 Tax=Solilutibacter silvestris TaxID=1645665 RepID=A0A2K1PZ63_9GAMM|nr:LytTR family DNA-binding domain-containing protein [Lysobacter silvestris]PNS08088.1 LytTr DNA-binding domain-containing protein [Lysobacter silvestris]
MESGPTTFYQRYLPWRRSFETGFWIIQFLVSAIANSITVGVDAQRLQLALAPWQAATLETSSALASLLLVPAVVWMVRRWPIHLDNLRRTLPIHVLASVGWSMLHVVGMVAIRKIVYASQGTHYDFDPWWSGFGYEYLKDVRSYASMVVAIEGYRFVMLRLQGEASLLDRPDEGPPVESIERPERFLIRKLNREFLVAANDIEWLQASGNYVNLRVRGHDYPLRSTIAGIEAKLDPERFLRIQRSYMVNLDQVVSIEPLDTGDARVHMRDGARLPCSRTYRNGLRQRFGQDG